uniref:Glycosyl transferase, group 1 n=1 Tax=Solibacter usitatus (strain Ellin6076) TaxID=234267 RepID=Q022V4_SOLUE
MPDADVRRVLMTGDTVGGVWTFTLDLARALQPWNIEVTLAAMGAEPTEEQREDAAAIANLQLMARPYKLEWMEDPWHDVEESGHWVLDLEQRLAPDVVHLNSYGHGCLRFHAPVLLTAHSCVLSWWAAVKGETIPVRWNRYWHEVENALNAVDLLTAPSHAMLRALEENYGTRLPSSRVVRNGRCASGFSPRDKQPMIVAAGRLWDEAKNISTLARVAESLEWPVYLAGDDRRPDGSTVDFTGCRKLGRLSTRELAGWYGDAAIYALPARYEPFGLSILEAALSGCALVLGDIESLRETWDEAALFVPPDDEGRLRSALCELIRRPGLREELARRSMARAAGLTADRMAREYASVYGRFAATRRTACGL